MKDATLEQTNLASARNVEDWLSEHSGKMVPRVDDCDHVWRRFERCDVVCAGSQGKLTCRVGAVCGRHEAGRRVWARSVAPAGPVLIYVELSRQRATVYRNGVRRAVSTLSIAQQNVHYRTMPEELVLQGESAAMEENRWTGIKFF